MFEFKGKTLSVFFCIIDNCLCGHYQSVFMKCPVALDHSSTVHKNKIIVIYFVLHDLIGCIHRLQIVVSLV